MIPGIDFRAFGYNARARAQAVYDGLARRYARLALEATKRGRIEVAARYVTKGLEGGQRKRVAPTPQSFAGLAEPPDQPHRTLADIKREATLQQRARLAELFKVAIARAGGVAFAVKLLDEGLKTRQIASVLQTLPEASQRCGSSGFAARLAARDALAAAPLSEPAPNRAAELIRAYNKALGIQD